MPSLRQKVTTYFRQLSFASERETRTAEQPCSRNIAAGSFITKYLDGTWEPADPSPAVYNGKTPEQMPEIHIARYCLGSGSISAAYTGPQEGLTGIRRDKHHVTGGPDIDFIDVAQEPEVNDANQNPTTEPKTSTSSTHEKLSHELADPIANVHDWTQSTQDAYGISISLYEKNLLTDGHIGDPVADCFGIVTRDDSCIMAMADGVNWGDSARVAARSAIQGSIEYLNSAVFGVHQVTSTRDIFVSLIRSFWEAHNYILQVGGALSTLTVAIVLPAGEQNRSVVCCCNVGDSLGYIYSKKGTVREITQGSHDINLMRDMRDALGAIGPVYDDKPEMSNMTLSMSYVDEGDIVFLTSDGISDNFDPVVGRFAEPASGGTKGYAADRKPTSAPSTKPPASANRPNRPSSSSTSSSANRDGKPPARAIGGGGARPPSHRQYARSKTFIEPSLKTSAPPKPTTAAYALPLVTGTQRHVLTLLRLADMLTYGIDGSLRPCTSAKQLCQLLIDFASCITAAKRKLLEQRELYYKVVTAPDGTRKEVPYTAQQHRMVRKRIIEGTTFSSLPGKLDHASIVAYTIQRKPS